MVWIMYLRPIYGRREGSIETTIYFGLGYWNINLEEMMEAGVHFCHCNRKWNPKMTPYISAKRKDIHITNITRTRSFFIESCDLVFDASSRGKQFLIVGTKNKEADSLEWAAIRARCHYANKKWLGVVVVLVSLVPLVVPIPVMLLGLFTSGIQDLIFATLAATYIGESMEGHH
ncbi:unnamed protein product [Withania somnifera]